MAGERPLLELELGEAVLDAFAELVRRHHGQPAKLLFGDAVRGLGVAFARGEEVSSYMLAGDGTIYVPNEDATHDPDDGVPDWLPEPEVD